MRTDEFFDKQPELLFINDLKSELYSEKPSPFGLRALENDEFEFNGLYLDKNFPDDDDLLGTIYEDVEKFLKICEIDGNVFPIKTIYKKTDTFEEYYIDVRENEIVVSAGDTEGIRRALVWIEDEMLRREGPYLPKGIVNKAPHIKTRITRCFFSPINRPPKNEDELRNDIDYYPEEYLNKLMHDGVNGLWIYTRFSDLFESSYIEEFGKDGFMEKRVRKLNGIIAKCKRYGIKIYVFAIEPIGLNREDAKKYPELIGGSQGSERAICINTKAGRDFCYESGKRLFQTFPDLGGYIGITYGERLTTCGSHITTNCPICKKVSRGELLAQGVNALMAGMKDQKPDADLVSWTYAQTIHGWSDESVEEYIEHLDDGISILQNFASNGWNEQLGKKRLAIDYWLSFIGPSDLFESTAKFAKKHGQEIYAKMQVCCSHEVASVPYVPVPGNVYDKYKAAHELGVTGVMQSWYFGNYPCLMSKAAGELAFEDFSKGKDDFIHRLAATTWGNTNAKTMVEAYNLFEKAYKNYPTNIMFSYYGPMHDSVVWQLQLLPKNYQLARTWQSEDPVDGDRIGECFINGHSLEEVITLTSEMVDLWKKGRAIAETLPIKTEKQRLELSVIKALEILFEGGVDILKFYQYRDLLGKNIDAKVQLEKMREIVLRGIEQSTEMIDVWKNDTRLGYHSEAEGYKFFPEKLEHRIAQLKNLLQTEFVEVEKRIEEGKYPLEYYLGLDDGTKRHEMAKGKLENSEWTYFDDNASKFRMSYDEDKMYLELVSPNVSTFYINPEFKMMTPGPTLILRKDKKPEVSSQSRYQGYFGKYGEEELSKWTCTPVEDENNKTHLIVTLNHKETAWEGRPFKFCAKVVHTEVGKGRIPWTNPGEFVPRLGRFIWSTKELGWILPQK